MKTRPHEETWEAIGIEVRAVDGAGSTLATFDSVHPEREEAIARLAAQAPAMARLLLELEWSGVSFGEDACPDCGALYVRKVHDADCELAAVLRAAGVLP